MRILSRSCQNQTKRRTSMTRSINKSTNRRVVGLLHSNLTIVAVVVGIILATSLPVAYCKTNDIIDNDNPSPTSSSSSSPSRSIKYSYEHSFSPSQEDYTLYRFDPNTAFGAPYGGYARNTRSRLAALPLRLVGGGTFPMYDGDGDGSKKEDSFLGIGLNVKPSTQTQTSQTKQQQQQQQPEKMSTPYFTVRDGEGRQFACRVYLEDELLPISQSQSIFDEALELGDDDVIIHNNDDDEKKIDENNNQHDDDFDYEDYMMGMMGDDKKSSSETMEQEGDGVDKIEKEVEQDETKIVKPPPPLEGDVSSPPPPSSLVDSQRQRSNKDAKRNIPTKSASTPTSAKEKGETPADDMVTVEQLNTVNRAVSKLEGKCAQIHQGWWSYEWCHEARVTQFHVEILQKRQIMDDAVKAIVGGHQHGGVKGNSKFIPEVVVESVTTVGLWDGKRKVLVVSKQFDDTKNKDKKNENDKEKKKGEVVPRTDSDDKTIEAPKDTKIVENTKEEEEETTAAVKLEKEETKPRYILSETFNRGDYCEEADKPRDIEVFLRCCDEKELKRAQVGVVIETSNSSPRTDGPQHSSESAFSNASKEPFALFLDMKEKSICKYEATVCTNVLCNNQPGGIWEDVVGEESSSGDTLSAVGSNTIFKGGSNKPKKVFKRDDSIREIIDYVLHNKCLEIKDGWWSYGFCHKKNIYQYHMDTVADPMSGRLKSVVDNKYTLGIYDSEISESFEKEDEVLHIRTSDSNDEGSVNLDEKSLTDSSSFQSSDGLGPETVYFIQTYSRGDVCSGSDVADSTIKGGAVVDGGIERSTTVRFTCGNELAIKQINEDSTCHYVLDVTIPDLCIHNFFETPRLKTQVVKCLPVIEA